VESGLGIWGLRLDGLDAEDGREMASVGSDLRSVQSVITSLTDNIPRRFLVLRLALDRERNIVDTFNIDF